MKHSSAKNWKEPVNKLTKVLADNSPTILTVFGCRHCGPDSSGDHQSHKDGGRASR